MENYIEFVTDIYGLEDVYKIQQALNDQLNGSNGGRDDRDEEPMDPTERLIHESLYGEQPEPQSRSSASFIPKPVQGRVLIDPREVVAVCETIVSLEVGAQNQNTKKALVLTLRCGSEQPISSTLGSYKRKCRTFFRKLELEQNKITNKPIK